jgi:hypothetical protein
LLILSVGTGLNAGANKNLKPRQMNLLYHATSVPSALIHSAVVEQDALCRVFGSVRYGDALDGEIGDLSGTAPPGGTSLFSYARYNVDLSREGLDALGLPEVDPRLVQRLDDVRHLDRLREVGERAARQQVAVEHFAGFP